MRKMMKGIAAVLAVSALMAGSAFAADKLIVKDSAGTNNVFKVDSAGPVESRNTTSADTTSVNAVYNNGTLRSNLRANGVQEWFMNIGTSEAGKIGYSTPGGGIGFGLYTGGTGGVYSNRLDIVNYSDNGAGAPVFTLGYNATVDGNGVYITKTGVAVGNTWQPQTNLEVIGGLRINDTPIDGAGWKASKPAACNANTDGTMFYTVGGAGTASKLELCQKSSGGSYSWVLIK